MSNPLLEAALPKLRHHALTKLWALYDAATVLAGENLPSAEQWETFYRAVADVPGMSRDSLFAALAEATPSLPKEPR